MGQGPASKHSSYRNVLPQGQARPRNCQSLRTAKLAEGIASQTTEQTRTSADRAVRRFGTKDDFVVGSETWTAEAAMKQDAASQAHLCPPKIGL
jgi:hypothetical protein